jgi:hypothetical protein
MVRKTAGFFVLLALVLLSQACRKLPTEGSGGIPVQTLQGSTTLSPEFGSLVSVSTSTTYPDLAQLWFQDKDGNVRIVNFSLPSRQLLNVMLIRRQ